MGTPESYGVSSSPLDTTPTDAHTSQFNADVQNAQRDSSRTRGVLKEKVVLRMSKGTKRKRVRYVGANRAGRCLADARSNKYYSATNE